MTADREALRKEARRRWGDNPLNEFDRAIPLKNLSDAGLAMFLAEALGSDAPKPDDVNDEWHDLFDNVCVWFNEPLYGTHVSDAKAAWDRIREKLRGTDAGNHDAALAHVIAMDAGPRAAPNEPTEHTAMIDAVLLLLRHDHDRMIAHGWGPAGAATAGHIERLAALRSVGTPTDSKEDTHHG